MTPSELTTCALLLGGARGAGWAPSELDAGGFVWVSGGLPLELGAGRMTGVLFIVQHGWVCSVCWRLEGLVVLKEVRTAVGAVEGKRLLSVWKMSASCLSEVAWNPGCLDSMPCNFLIACTKSAMIFLVLSVGDSWGIQQC